jgi:hypothetical protein
MRLSEILEGGTIKPIKPLTPEQTNKREDRRRRQQQRITDERARSAARVRDLQTDMP